MPRHGEPSYPGLPPLAVARVSGAFAQPVVRTARELGVDLRCLGEACGLRDLERGLPPEISVETYLALLDGASRRLNDPLFGLRVGERTRVTDHPGYGLALCACATYREVVDQTLRFESLAHDLGRSEVIVRDAVVRYRWHSRWPHRPGSSHVVGAIAASIRSVANWLVGGVVPVLRFSFAHAAPAAEYQAEYSRILCAPAQFDADFNEAHFAETLLDMPLPSVDRTLLPLLTQAAEKRLEARKRAAGAPLLVSEVRAHIRAQMSQGRTSLSQVASALDTPPRTLQRRLAVLGLNFGTLLDEERREQVQLHLRDDTLSLAEVAFLLGFSEQSAFNHAFRRWFGATPGEWRNCRN